MTTLEEVRARFARGQGLPFADSLSELSILDALNEHGIKYRNRVFAPVTTIWGFLSQVLGEDHSCRDAVSRIIAHRAMAGLKVCSPNTASYCNARARIPNAVLRCLARRTAQQLQASLPGAWKWNGRSVFIADGSHVSMPDTQENQAGYPQPVVQQPGIGFPLARVAVLLSLATGACHDLAIAPYAGKGTGETTLLRQMYDSLSPGDVVLADALFDNYFLACEFRWRGVDLVARVQAERVGTRTVEGGPDGDIIVWQRPNKPHGMMGQQYRRYPESLTMRQVSVDARGSNNRAERFKVVTTILDASIDGGQIGELYEERWSGEVDIRSIKSTMKMDVLRCNAGDGGEGDMGSSAGVQPAAHGNGRRRQRERHGAPRDQLQGGQAGPDGIRPEAGSGAAGAACGAGGCHAEGGGVPACGQPAWAVGAAGSEAKAEALQAPGASSPHRQTGAQSR